MPRSTRFSRRIEICTRLHLFSLRNRRIAVFGDRTKVCRCPVDFSFAVQNHDVDWTGIDARPIEVFDGNTIDVDAPIDRGAPEGLVSILRPMSSS